MSSKLVSTTRSLRYRKARRRRGLAVLEGARLVEEALAANLVIRGALVSIEAGGEGRVGEVLAALRDRSVPVETLDASEFDDIAETETPQGILAVVEQRSVELCEIGVDAGGLALVLDAVQDPGNVGSMIRSAHALGASGVVLLPGSADLWNPKVLRSAMGASFKIPVAVAGHRDFAKWCNASDLEVWAGSGTGVPLCEIEAGTVSRALVLGNEGAGLSPELRALVDREVGIPIAGDAESLNVGVAAGILMHEMLKGRTP